MKAEMAFFGNKSENKTGRELRIFIGMDSNVANRKKLKIVIYGTIIIGLIIFSIQILFLTKSKAELELEKIISKMNEACPHEIDSQTTVQSVHILAKNKISLSIVLPDISKSIFQNDFFKDSVYLSLQKQIKVNEFFKPLYKKDVTMVCSYYDKNPKLLFELSIKVNPD